MVLQGRAGVNRSRFSGGDPSGRPNPVTLGGWLFADLLLALSLIFLAAIPGAPKGALAALGSIPTSPTRQGPPSQTSTPTATPSPTPTLSPTPRPTRTPTPTVTPTATAACVSTVLLTKNTYDVANDNADVSPSIPSVEHLRNAFRDVQGKRAGLVLTYVHAPGDGEGQQLASVVNQRLLQARPDVFTHDTIYDDFDWKDRNPAAYGTVEFEIYFLSSQCRGR